MGKDTELLRGKEGIPCQRFESLRHFDALDWLSLCLGLLRGLWTIKCDHRSFRDGSIHPSALGGTHLAALPTLKFARQFGFIYQNLQ